MKVSRTQKSLGFGAGGAVYTAGLVAIITAEGGNISAINWLAVVVSAFPGMLVGWMLSIITNARADIQQARKDLHDEVSRLTDAFDKYDIPSLLGKAERCLENYLPIAKVLKTHKSQIAFVSSLLDKAMEHYLMIPRAEPALFYDYLIDGLNNCEKWDGIHQGSLTLLGNNPPGEHNALQYFKALGEVSRNGRCNTRRVIILGKKFEQELKNPKIMNEFWTNTGKYMECYWITQGDIDAMIGPEKARNLDDCALYDPGIVLHYDRDAKVITIELDDNQNTVAHVLKIIFENLDDSLKQETAFKFTKITQETIDLLNKA